MREIWMHDRSWDESKQAWNARGFVARFGAEIEWSATKAQARSEWKVELLLQKLTPEEADFASLMILEEEPPLHPLISDYLERAVL